MIVVKDNQGVIYMIKNTINGKVYIGRTNDLKRRRREHLTNLRNNKHYNRHLQYSFNKYGETNFKFIILEKCKDDEVGQREIDYIKKYNSFKAGYNLTAGGDGGQFGVRYSEEYKQRLSESLKGIKLSEEHKKRISIAQKKLWGNEDYRKEMSKRFRKGHIGLKHSKETRHKMIASSSKRKLSKEDVINIRLRYLKGERQCDILEDYKHIITRATMSKVCLGQTFKNIPNTIEELEKLKEAK